MKHTLTIGLCALYLAWTGCMVGYAKTTYHSRGSAFELSVGGGYGSLGYKTADVENWTSNLTGRPSGYLHVAYDCFFTEYFGLSLGVDFSRYGSALQFSGKQLWKDVVDNDDFLGGGKGELYDHTLTINNWQELQSVSYVEIPLSVKFSAPAGGIYVIGEVGGKAGFPVLGNYKGSGSVTHTGYYKPWDLTLQDIDGHGFYTENGFQPQGNLDDTTIKWSLFAKLGIAIPLIQHLDLTVQAFAQYAFIGSTIGGTNLPGYRDDKAGMQDLHYFMNSYSSTLFSSLATGSTHPWHTGLEVGIRYTIPHQKARSCYSCRILEGSK